MFELFELRSSPSSPPRPPAPPTGPTAIDRRPRGPENKVWICTAQLLSAKKYAASVHHSGDSGRAYTIFPSRWFHTVMARQTVARAAVVCPPCDIHGPVNTICSCCVPLWRSRSVLVEHVLLCAEFLSVLCPEIVLLVMCAVNEHAFVRIGPIVLSGFKKCPDGCCGRQR